MPNKAKWTWWIAGVLMVIFAAILSATALWKFRHGLYNALDLAIFNQVFWQTTHGSFFGMTIHPHSYLGDHFDLFILLLAPFYAVLPRPETLLVLQALAVASAPIPLLLLRAGDMVRSKTAAVLALLGTIIWVLNPYLHNAFFFEFHTLMFAAPLLAWSYWAYRKRRLNLFSMFLVLLLTLREDVALTVMAFALLALFERRTLRWWLPQAAVAVAWFFGATAISSSLNTSGQYKFFILYSWMGEGTVQILRFFVTKPVEIIRHLVSSAGVQTLFMAFSSMMWLPLLTPRVLVLAVPSLLIMGLSNRGLDTSFLVTHYQVIFLTVLLIAFFDVIPLALRLRERVGTHARILTSFFAGILALLLIVVAIDSSARSPFFVRAAEHGIFRLPQRSPEMRQTVLNTLKDVDRVLAGSAFLTNFGDRDMLMAFHYAYIGRKQFSAEPFPLPPIDAAVFDTDEIIRLIAAKDDFTWASEGIHAGSDRLRAYLEREGLHPEWTFDDTILFTKTGTLEPFTLAEAETQTVSFGRIELKPCDATFCLSMETLHPAQSEDIMVRMAFVKEEGKEAWQSFYLPAYGLFMPHAFETPQRVTTNFRLALPEFPDGHYAVRLSLEPILGEHVISMLRHAAFTPEDKNPKLDERRIASIRVQDGEIILAEDEGDSTRIERLFAEAANDSAARGIPFLATERERVP